MTRTATTEAKAKSPRTGVRITFLLLLWLFTAGIVAQVVLIGLGIFYDPTYSGIHADLGWMLGHMVGPIVLIVGFFGRLGRTLVIVNAVNLVLVLALPILASMRTDVPIVAAFHPLAAVTVLVLTLWTAARVRRLVPAPWGSAPGQPTPPAQGTPPPRPTATPGTPPTTSTVPPRTQQRM